MRRAVWVAVLVVDAPLFRLPPQRLLSRERGDPAEAAGEEAYRSRISVISAC
jgi:hypothetical protein